MRINAAYEYEYEPQRADSALENPIHVPMSERAKVVDPVKRLVLLKVAGSVERKERIGSLFFIEEHWRNDMTG